MKTNQLFEKQMTRKEFLKFGGMAILAIFGVNNFVSFILQNSGQRKAQSQVSKTPSSHGFGASKFGV